MGTTTKITLTYLIALVCVIYVNASEWVSFPGGTNEPEPPNFTVMESNAERTVLKIDIPGMLVGEIEVDEETYDTLVIPEYLYTGEVGKAQIPALGEFIAIPGTKDFSVDIIKTDTTTLDGYYVYPAQEPFCEEEPPFAKDEIFYQTDEFYPGETIELGGASIWRDLRVINPGIYPIKYNPVTSQLEVTYSITLRFSYFGTSEDNIIEGPDYPDYAIEERYAQSYRSSIVNYSNLGLEEVYWKLGNPCDYLIIYSPAIEYQLNNSGIIEHLSSRGFAVSTVSTGAIGNNPDAIKNYIKGEYNTHGIDYVLFVGYNYENPVMKVLPARYDNPKYDYYNSDYYYALLAGDDILPEVSIGRLCTSGSLNWSTDKIINYENGIAPGPWPRNNLLVAHKDRNEGDWDSDFQYTKECISDFDYASYDPIFYTAFGSEGYNNDHVTYYINEGCGTVNYNGHGDDSTWSEWNQRPCHPEGECHWQGQDIEGLSNGNKTPVVFNVCCKNGQSLAIDWIDCYIQGAVGSVGFMESCWGPSVDFLDKYIYHALYHHDVLEFGNSLNHALSDLVKKASTESDKFKDSAADNTLMCVLYGEPSMVVRTGALVGFSSVSHDHSAVIGQNLKSVIVAGPQAVPIENAVVCLYQPGGIHDAKATDSAGRADFSFQLNSTEDINVTVWKPGYVPYSGIMVVEE